MSIGHHLFSFYGRIGRLGFWKGLALNGLMIFTAVLISELMEPRLLDLTLPLSAYTPDVYAVLIYFGGFILSFVSCTALTVKRCRDRGKSGWYILLSLIPFVGTALWLVDFGLLAGKQKSVAPKRLAS